MVGFQSVGLEKPQNPFRWLEKVNAEKKIGVDFF